MSIACLMPTYGRRQSLLNNAIACFAAQTYPDKFLLIYDDLGTLENAAINRDDCYIMSSPRRASSVGGKYNRMLQFAESLAWSFDAVAVFDDDDIYLPGFLSSHAEVLAQHGWSKPSTIISAYHQPPKEESAAGRFHGSIAVNYEMVKRVGGWIDTTRATFDQEFLSLLKSQEAPGDPCNCDSPQYVYRWQTSRAGHCSGLMGSPTWYADYRPDSREPIDRLWPEFDEDTARFIDSIPAAAK